MTKREFLDRLERCLASLEDGERANMVEFYREQIEDRIDDGMAEEEAVASLEKPEDIAANILALRAEAAEAPNQGGGPISMADGNGEPKKGHRALRGIGRAILGFFEVLLVICLIPVAFGVAAALIGAYLSLWAGVACLGAGSVCCILFGGLCIVTTVASPVASVPVTVACMALIVGSLSLAVLAAVAAYFCGKLLVMLVVWAVRGISRAIRRRRGADRAAGQPAARRTDYPSMPMPPMADGPPEKRRGMPVWAKFTIFTAVLALCAAIAGVSAMAVAGGPEKLLGQAGVSKYVPVLAVDGSEVDTIDLSAPDGADDRAALSVSIATSPDGNVYVVGSNPAASGSMFWGSIETIGGAVDDSAIKLETTTADGMVVQNFFTMLNTIYRCNGIGDALVLVPEDWQGDVVCNGGGTLYSWTGGGLRTPVDGTRRGVRIDGDIDVQVDDTWLDNIEADAVRIDAEYATLTGVRADEVSVNEGTQHDGSAYLADIDVAGSLRIGGRAVSLGDNVDAGTIQIDDGTRTERAERG